MIVVTDHAVERYIERVENVTPDKARSLMLSNKAVQLAAKFGAPYIRLHSGHRIVLSGYVVKTVLPPKRWYNWMSPKKSQQPPER